jgi:hypothetical protein
MNQNTLIEIVKNLIDSHKEDDYYDFKQEWHKDNDALLHDILCLANCITHHGDRYLIFGVTDKTREVIGVKDDPNRRKQADILDFLSKLDFNGDYRPSISLQMIEINEKEIDVLIIDDLPFKPYLLRTKTQHKQVLPVIYTRVGDRNTPKFSSADYNLIEKMFEERFGLSRTPYERMVQYLADYENWSEIDYIDDKDITQYYYNKFPEFTLHYWNDGQESVKWDEKDCQGDKFLAHKVDFMYYSTLLTRTSIYTSKDARFSFMRPRSGESFYDGTLFYPVIYDYENTIFSNTIDFVKKINGVDIGDHCIEVKYYRFITFKNKEEKNKFFSKENQVKALRAFFEQDPSMKKQDKTWNDQNSQIEREFRAFIFDYYQKWKEE